MKKMLRLLPMTDLAIYQELNEQWVAPERLGEIPKERYIGNQRSVVGCKEQMLEKFGVKKRYKVALRRYILACL